MAKAGRPKGQKKTGGRQKGTPNRMSLDIKDRLEHIGFDIVAEAYELYRSKKTMPDTKFRILELMVEYTNYKPKNPLEVPPGPGGVAPPLTKESKMSDDELEDAVNDSDA